MTETSASQVHTVQLREPPAIVPCTAGVTTDRREPQRTGSCTRSIDACCVGRDCHDPSASVPPHFLWGNPTLQSDGVGRWEAAEIPGAPETAASTERAGGSPRELALWPRNPAREQACCSPSRPRSPWISRPSTEGSTCLLSTGHLVHGASERGARTRNGRRHPSLRRRWAHLCPEPCSLTCDLPRRPSRCSALPAAPVRTAAAARLHRLRADRLVGSLPAAAGKRRTRTAGHKAAPGAQRRPVGATEPAAPTASPLEPCTSTNLLRN